MYVQKKDSERAREKETLCVRVHVREREIDSVIEKETHTCQERVRVCLCERDSE